jgi:dihydrofolate synthase/folylpolyglutamate synthase
MGRWECIQESPRVILDVAHNEHGIHALLEQLTSLHYQQLHIVTGMVKDKDIQAVLQLLPKNALYYFTQSHIPRALPVHELAAQAAVLGLNGQAFEDVNIALKDAIKNANHHDLILVIGSVFLVAEVDRTHFL